MKSNIESSFSRQRRKRTEPDIAEDALLLPSSPAAPAVPPSRTSALAPLTPPPNTLCHMLEAPSFIDISRSREVPVLGRFFVSDIWVRALSTSQYDPHRCQGDCYSQYSIFNTFNGYSGEHTKRDRVIGGAHRGLWVPVPRLTLVVCAHLFRVCPSLKNASVGPAQAALVHHAVTDPDTLRAFCLAEKCTHHIARHFFSMNFTVIFDIDQKPKSNLCSFDSGHLAAIKSLSVVVDSLIVRVVFVDDERKLGLHHKLRFRDFERPPRSPKYP
ncbi:hypothetical protein EV421DRAFT_2024544 [Armillaria borealis]|uniref:Uncharacterized protein n=1 Tax=Armillaria borealis TaxID=47425 RepID=A0AA39IZ00_9AGAR|nr:hypothetical protein EV421DRAFT_2024544 [Armillaria borealis]